MTVSDPATPTCYRHAGRETRISCTRCDRYICTDCMRSAAVGFQCPECVKEGNKNVRQAKTVFGANAATAGGTPVVTIGLIIANFVVFAAEVLKRSVVDDLALLPNGLRGPDGGVYHPMALPPDGFHQIGVAHGQWYRLFSSMFTHSLPTMAPFGPTHILFNMTALWMFGNVLEARLGRLRFLSAYVLCGLGGSVLVYFLAPQYSETIGASGAIFGLVGMYWVMQRKMHFDPIGAQPQLILAIVWLVASSKVASWQGHLGGLGTGLAIGAVFAYAPRARQGLIQAAGLVVILALLVGATVARTSDLTSATKTPNQNAEGTGTPWTS